jgi:arabinogalactan endo-1,4-beta-galactosidase
MKHIKTLLLALCLTTGIATQAQEKLVGGDISLLPKYERAGAKYYDHNGNLQSDVLSFFKNEGLNCMRVRLFVDPDNYTGSDKDANACQDLDWVKTLGKRIKDAGMQFMLDFHYSDTWADPSNQWTPASWASLSDDQLAQKLYSYTADVLEQLTAAGAQPDLIATGNEISYGMLWGAKGSSNPAYCYPSSSTANWNRFCKLLDQATKACRATCPKAKIILHVERVSASVQGDNANYVALTGFFDKMKAKGIDYDVIGLSYYPYHHGTISDLEGAISKAESYGKEIMVVETGYPYAWEITPTFSSYKKPYDYSDAGQKAYVDDLITMLNKHSKVTGLFWWWMEYNAYGTSLTGWYNAPLFDSRNGRACSALSELKTFLGSSNGISRVSADNPSADDRWYTLSGQAVSKATQQGVYIHNGKKLVVR